MASVSCPSCFALVRSPASGRFRGFLTCSACGHRFLASIEDAVETKPGSVGVAPSGTTEALHPSEIEAALRGVEVPEEADFTRESARREEPPAARSRARLVKLGSGQDTFSLERFQFVIGREGADLSLNDPAISRRHAVIENHADRYLLKDLGSTNGTYLNGRRIAVEFLEHGDVVQVGRTRIRFENPRH